MKNKAIIKRIAIITIISLITIVCVFSLFSNKYYPGDDGTFHINRIIGLANAFEERQILPKIYPYANNGFGYATPLFYCDIFLYPFGILHHFGVGAVLCYKIAIIFYVLIGNLLAYYVCKKITGEDLLSIIGLLLYGFSNYHLQNILLRSAFGEVLAMAFLPLAIYGIYKVLINNEDSWIILGIGFSLLVMSHLITTLLLSALFLVLIVAYIIIYRNKTASIKRTLITITKATVLALLLTAWYLIPMIEQLNDQTFWLSINASNNDISLTVQSLKNIITPFACTDLNTYSIYTQASTGIALLVLPVLYLTVKKNKYISIILVYSIVLLLINLGILPYKFLNIVQFLFRNYIIISVLLTVVSIYVIKRIKYKKIITILIIIYSIINGYMTNIQIIRNVDKYLVNNSSLEDINSIFNYKYSLNYNHDELGGAEYLPYSEKYINYNKETPAIKYIDKNGNMIDSIWEYDRKFTCIEFKCNYANETTLLLPLSYYKGYTAYEIINGKYRKMDISNNEDYKLVSIKISPGSHTYMVRYDGTIVQKITLLISSTSFIVLIVYVVIKKRNKANV